MGSPEQAGMTKGGYEKWVHSDGSKVWIGPDSGIDKIPPGDGAGVWHATATWRVRIHSLRAAMRVI
jgi:hypothetical protein